MRPVQVPSSTESAPAVPFAAFRFIHAPHSFFSTGLTTFRHVAESVIFPVRTSASMTWSKHWSLSFGSLSASQDFGPVGFVTAFTFTSHSDLIFESLILAQMERDPAVFIKPSETSLTHFASIS